MTHLFDNMVQVHLLGHLDDILGFLLVGQCQPLNYNIGAVSAPVRGIHTAREIPML